MEKIELKFLNKNYIPEIHECLMQSFADYSIDMSYLTLNRMTNRQKMDRVDYELSVGAFVDSKMVGFLVIGKDLVNDELCAFDAGTGIIPEYRGKGLAGSLFNFALQKLKSENIKSFILEVLQNNEPAIKAYKKANFTISREFNCYKLNTVAFIPIQKKLPDVSIKKLDKVDFSKYVHFNDWDVSWEYSLSAIKNIDNEIIINGAFIDRKCVGFIVYYPSLQWIFMLSVDKQYRKKKIGSLLLQSLILKVKESTTEIKFNNVPPKHEMCTFLEKQGFEIYTTQYEMILKIDD